MADRGDRDQQPPEGAERQTVSAAQDRVSAGRASRQGDAFEFDAGNPRGAASNPSDSKSVCVCLQMTIEMYPSDQVADLRAEVTHWYENLQKEQMNQQAQLQEFGQSGRQGGDFPGQIEASLLFILRRLKPLRASV